MKEFSGDLVGLGVVVQNAFLPNQVINTGRGYERITIGIHLNSGEIHLSLRTSHLWANDNRSSFEMVKTVCLE